MPILRELVSFKNTVCSNIAEIKSLISDIESRLRAGEIQVPEMPLDASESGLDHAGLPDYWINYANLEDDLWYLKMIRNEGIKSALVKVGTAAIE